MRNIKMKVLVAALIAANANAVCGMDDLTPKTDHPGGAPASGVAGNATSWRGHGIFGWNIRGSS